jgi:glycosyltransferase involved in cell wall biosynthesis
MSAVTVLLPFCQIHSYLSQAIASILQQTFIDFELLLINDGLPMDKVSELCGVYNDARLRIIGDERKNGLAKSLNSGIAHAKGKYIVRMDSDDVSLPQRLERQFLFMESHPEVGILGSAIRLIDERGRKIGSGRYPLDDLAIRWRVFFEAPFAHPAVMLRRNVLAENSLFYDTEFLAAQDYELWPRLLGYAKGANLKEALLLYRVHRGAVTANYRQAQSRNSAAISLRCIEKGMPEFKLSVLQLNLIREVILNGRRKAARESPGQVLEIVRIYMDMLGRFMQGNPLRRMLIRQESGTVFLACLCLPFSWRLLRLCRRLLRMNPFLFWSTALCIFRGLSDRAMKYNRVMPCAG